MTRADGIDGYSRIQPDIAVSMRLRPGVPVYGRPVTDPDIDYAYVLVANDLERRIKSGELPRGARLPSRDELAAEYGHAPMTIRRATQLLRRRDLVKVLPGRGTFVIWGSR
jgi:regulatory GntR family protein